MCYTFLPASGAELYRKILRNLSYKFYVSIIWCSQVADYKMAFERTAWVINGPTKGNSLGAFSWLPYKNSSHVGLPESYDFDFILMEPLFK